MARRIAKGVGELFPFNGFKEWTGSFPAFQTQEIDQQPLGCQGRVALIPSRLFTARERPAVADSLERYGLSA